MLDQSPLQILKSFQQTSTEPVTRGLREDQVKHFLATDPRLLKAIELAAVRRPRLIETFPEANSLPEMELVRRLHEGVLNFYPEHFHAYFVPVGAHGPWIITFHGAVIYETGGYGMLGHGHGPKEVIEAMAEDRVIANVMVASFEMRGLIDRLQKHIGASRGGCPFEKFIFMNSGSESVSVAARLAECNTKILTEPGAKHEGKKIVRVALQKAFHGRTYRAAEVSDSCRKRYERIASFRDGSKTLITVESNSVESLEAAFKKAEKENLFIEALYIEPIQGEGNPGVQTSPEFYKRARELTLEHGSFLIIDSIQAGIRGHGVLSIVDYPGFESLDAPDLETYSKALNAGQYPLSVLAVGTRAVEVFAPGIYGNTMTGNPRAMAVASAVMDQLTPEIQKNIVERGKEFVEKLKSLQTEFPKVIRSVHGTGLLIAAELFPEYPVTGECDIEQMMRARGVNVIHGGQNALRYTPTFRITSEEIDLIIDTMRECFQERQAQC